MCGVLHSVDECFWKRVDMYGDDLEFINFLALNIHSFGELVHVCSPYVKATSYTKYNHSVNNNVCGIPLSWDLCRRNLCSRDIVALTLHYLLSQASHKDICTHFGVTEAMFGVYYIFGLEIFMYALVDNPLDTMYRYRR